MECIIGRDCLKAHIIEQATLKREAQARHDEKLLGMKQAFFHHNRGPVLGQIAFENHLKEKQRQHSAWEQPLNKKAAQVRKMVEDGRQECRALCDAILAIITPQEVRDMIYEFLDEPNHERKIVELTETRHCPLCAQRAPCPHQWGLISYVGLEFAHEMTKRWFQTRRFEFEQDCHTNWSLRLSQFLESNCWGPSLLGFKPADALRHLHIDITDLVNDHAGSALMPIKEALSEKTSRAWRALALKDSCFTTQEKSLRPLYALPKKDIKIVVRVQSFVPKCKASDSEVTGYLQARSVDYFLLRLAEQGFTKLRVVLVNKEIKQDLVAKFLEALKLALKEESAKGVSVYSNNRPCKFPTIFPMDWDLEEEQQKFDIESFCTKQKDFFH